MHTPNLSYMCVFNDYIRLQEELKEMQKEIINTSKNYNKELKLFQKGNIIDSINAQKIKQKFDDVQQANAEIASKQTAINMVEQEIQEYLSAMNGMAIRYNHNYQGLNQAMIFEMEIDSYGEPKVKVIRENWYVPIITSTRYHAFNLHTKTRTYE